MLTQRVAMGLPKQKCLLLVKAESHFNLALGLEDHRLSTQRSRQTCFIANLTTKLCLLLVEDHCRIEFPAPVVDCGLVPETNSSLASWP
jgi:hypothetical protein